jgi:hypothetical protein
MEGAWYSDARHFMNERGELNEMAAPAVSNAIFLRSVVGWVTARNAHEPERTNVPCRRSRARDRCFEEVDAWLSPDGGEVWYVCPGCAENGVIHGWKGGSWDRSSFHRVQPRRDETTAPALPTDRGGPT